MGNSNNKLKVAWLCYFTNKEVQDMLKPRKRVNDIAPWISSMITLFENDPEVELHVVSEHRWISGIKHFESKGVHYHFYNRGIPMIGRHWPGFFRFDMFSDYFFLKRTVANIIHGINPDIIHLQGAENEFCIAITQFHNKYPVLTTIQGFIHKSNDVSKVAKRRMQKELEILRLFNHYGYRTKTMGEDVKAINPNAVLHWHQYPMKEIATIETKKKYDLAFFARICKDKGIEDLLKAVAIIKKDKPDISLCVIGGGNYTQFEHMANDLGLKENVTWAGFLPSQEEVHKLAGSARVSVLPTYHDIISGTIIESLFLKLPVVAYNVGSIHEVNEKEEIISLVEKLNVEGLAKAILELLNDDKLRMERADKGYRRALKMFSAANEEIRDELMTAYEDVRNDFKKVKFTSK
jgi:glycosyltransferase involved in cell wall biosynthesis